MSLVSRALLLTTALPSAAYAAAQPSFQGDRRGPDLLSDIHVQLPCDDLPRFDRFEYSREKRGTVHVYRNRKVERAPIVISLQSYGAIPEVDRYSIDCLLPFLHKKGFAIAGIGLRDSRSLTGAEFASEMAGAVGQIVRRADKYGFDPARIVLLGKGSSAHFAALLGTDPTYLTEAGVDFRAMRAVLVVDGLDFDIPASLARASAFRSKHLLQLGGGDIQSQRRMSPVAHLALPNAPRFLFHAVETNSEGVAQAEQFAAALRAAGTAAEVRQLTPTRRKFPSTYIGSDPHPENDELLRFLREAVGP
jgi:arylformamidase